MLVSVVACPKLTERSSEGGQYMKFYRLFVGAMMLLLVGTVCHAKTKFPVPVADDEAKQVAAATKVDLNRASQAELEKLPGVGPAMAKKIVAGRPYASAGDLVKAGIPAKTVDKITPLVFVGAAPAAAGKATLPTAYPTRPPASPAPQPAGAAKAAKPVTPPPAGKDMVWVNTESKIFHKQGSKWYGKTKQGNYMTESEAIKAGYRESRTGGK